VDTNDSIWIYNSNTLKKELLFKRDFIQKADIGHGIISPSTRYILIPIKREKVKKIKIIFQG
jgi:hypothetical protein